MSAAPRHRSSWLSQNYEKVILVAILIGLLFSSVFLFMKVGQRRQMLTDTPWAKTHVPKKVEAIEPLMAQFDQLKGVLISPFQSGQYSNRMFISELRVSCVKCQKPILFDAEVCPFCQAQQPVRSPREKDSDGDGVPDQFEREHGMNPMDANDADVDMDKDGFLNIEEYRAGTKLNDAEDYPSPAAKLRILRIGANPFKLRFQGEARTSQGVFYQLNLRSLERTYFVRIGDELEGFTVMECDTNAPVGPTIVLKQGDTFIPLVKGKTKEGYEKVAELVFLIDKKRMVVRFGDTIKLKDQEYKVIDIRRDGVLIRDERTGKDIEVGPLSDGEKSAWERNIDDLSPLGGATLDAK